MPTFRPNTLYYGDNLTVLRDFPAECVDLIYLDPPFNSNRSYNVLFKEDTGREAEAQIQAFEDTWHWGQATSATHEIYNEFVARGTDDARLLEALVKSLGHNDVTAYLTMMAPRLVELRRVLKPTGSIYLHCDPTAGHYLKVLMDAVFGAVNFKNEIVWKRTSAHSSGKKFGPIHDLLLFYSRSEQASWNTQRVPLAESYKESHYKYLEDGRRYKRQDITGAGVRHGETGRPWHGIDPTAKGRHWMHPPSELERLDAEGMIYWPDKSGAWPYFKLFLDRSLGQPVQDIWDDIERVNPMALERLGYPTQKPEALLRRVIEASSNSGDIVLDPFCGCGTAVVAAHRLGRQWVGIDITYLAVDLMVNRLKTTFPHDFTDGVQVDGEPADEAAALALAGRDKYQFQFWSVARVGGTARGGENRKGADRGIDGVMTFPEMDPNGELKAQTGRGTRRTKKAALITPKIVYKQVLISVKGGATGPHHVRELIGTVDREGAAIGVLVTARQPTPDMYRDAAEAGVYESPSTGKSYPKIQIITAGEIVQGKRIDMPPKRGLTQYQPAQRARRGEQLMIREPQAPSYVAMSSPGTETFSVDGEDDSEEES